MRQKRYFFRWRNPQPLNTQEQRAKSLPFKWNVINQNDERVGCVVSGTCPRSLDLHVLLSLQISEFFFLFSTFLFTAFVRKRPLPTAFRVGWREWSRCQDQNTWGVYRIIIYVLGKKKPRGAWRGGPRELSLAVCHNRCHHNNLSSRHNKLVFQKVYELMNEWRTIARYFKIGDYWGYL